MPEQTGSNVVVAYKVESVFNTAPGASGAKVLRIKPSPGMGLQRADIQSQVIRSDGLAQGTRKGSSSAPGTYNCELAVGEFEEIIEAIMRSTVAAAVPITVDGGAARTSFTVTDSNTVTMQGTDSLITLGLRNGDVVRFTGMSTAANNNINLIATNVAANSFDVLGTPLTAQGADTAATLTILKKIKNGATPTRRTFYIDEYMRDNDISEAFGGVRWVSLELTGSPDGMADLVIGVLGVSATDLATGASPYYTTPTEYVSIPLVFADGSLAIAGVRIATMTSFRLRLELNASTLGVLGSSTSPDVFEDSLRCSGEFSVLKKDATNLSRLKNETPFEISILLEEPDAVAPKDCMHFFVPEARVASPTKQIGGTGALTESVGYTANPKAAATGYDATLVTISTS